MKLFEILKAGWQSLDDEGKARVLSEVTPNGIFREIVMTFDQQFQEPNEIVDENEDDVESDDDIIEAEFTEIKDGFGA